MKLVMYITTQWLRKSKLFTVKFFSFYVFFVHHLAFVLTKPSTPFWRKNIAHYTSLKQVVLCGNP